MNKNTKTFGAVVASLALFCALGAAYFTGNNVGLFSNNAGTDEYVLNLGSEKNKANIRKAVAENPLEKSSYDGSFDATTDNGNIISFGYSGLDFSKGWGVFNANSTLANITRISGITSISLTFDSYYDNLKLAYGWLNKKTSDITYSVDDVTLSSTSSTFNFYNDGPDAFKVYNSSSKAVQINNVVVNYSCSGSDDPYACDNLDSLTFTYSRYYNEFTVKNYSGYHTSVTVPSKVYDGYRSAIVTTIANSAFASSRSMQEIHLPDTITTIGNSAFYDCSSLSSFTMPNSVTSIGNNVFNACPSLRTVTLSNQLTTIPINTFFNCQSLTSVYIPSSVTKIDNFAFAYCYSLQSVVIPTSVTTIKSNAFGYGVWGFTIFYEGTSIPSGWKSDCIDSNDKICLYSEEAQTGGTYWHYVNGVPTIWY